MNNEHICNIKFCQHGLNNLYFDCGSNEFVLRMYPEKIQNFFFSKSIIKTREKLTSPPKSSFLGGQTVECVRYG